KQGPLLWRNAKAEQQGGRARQQTRRPRMKQVMQTPQRLDALRRIDLCRQQCREINPGKFRHKMRKPDEAAGHAVTIEAVCKMGVPRTPDEVTLVPIATRLMIEQRPQPFAIETGIGGRGPLSEELPELRIVGECPDTSELELEQREVRVVEIDR